MKIHEFRGGFLRGVEQSNAPGIDAFLDGNPITIKHVFTSRLRGIVRQVNRARSSAIKAGYSDIEAFIIADQFGMDDVLKFVNGGNIPTVPGPGQALRTVNILTRDGWLIVG